MISKEEIQKLAELARLKLTDDETASLQKDISNILEYVGQLGAGAATPVSLQGDRGWSPEIAAPAPLVHNVMREDIARTQGDILADKRDALLKALPKREGDYNVVRKIIQKDE